MDSEEEYLTAAEYFQRTNSQTMFLPDTNLPSNSTFHNYMNISRPMEIPCSTVGNGHPFPFSNMAYHSEPFKSFQPSHKLNPFNVSRFNWSEDIRPEFSSSSESAPSELTCLNMSHNTKSPTGSFGYKRKTQSPPPVPLKQHITEERMAEHMSQLCINSEAQTSPKESETVRERRLYMCDEMQRLQAESILPIHLLETIPRTCTALIPWTPPLLPLSKEEKKNKEKEVLDKIVPQSTDSNIMDTSM